MPWGQMVDTEQYIKGMQEAAANGEFIKTLSNEEIMIGIENHRAKDSDFSRGVVAYLEIILGERARATA